MLAAPPRKNYVVLHFRLGDTNLSCASTEGVLIGETLDGQPFEGVDDVHMIDN